MSKKIHIDQLIIEVTRRCNMSCVHCMRGKSQNCDIDNKYIEGLFLKVESIGNLNLTGGEPSLVPEKIQTVIDLAEKHKVSIDHFYIVTNGKKVTNEFMKAILNLYMFCDSKELCELCYSNDNFHECCIDNENEYKRNMDLLKAFSFTRTKYSPLNGEIFEHDENNIIRQGEGYQNYGDSPDDTHNIYPIDFYDNESAVSDGLVYLNALGNILLDCDLSYETQDNDFFNLGNIIDIDIIEEIKNFNERLENIGENNITVILMELEELEYYKVA